MKTLVSPVRVQEKVVLVSRSGLSKTSATVSLMQLIGMSLGAEEDVRRPLKGDTEFPEGIFLDSLWFIVGS